MCYIYTYSVFLLGLVIHVIYVHVFLFLVQLSRDKKSLEDKLSETQSALEGEENKSKTEHRLRLKLESGLQDSEEKLDRENKVCVQVLCSMTYNT